MRKNRIWYPGALYHITSRGNHRNDIFRDDEDYLIYLKILKEVMGKLSFELVTYCFMTNHVHLQIKTIDSNIKDIMKRINQKYTWHFNKKYNYIGHLFQGRYGSELIEEDRYALEVSRYIHLNPVRANMVKKPEEYEWSSYGMYIGLEKEKLINSDKILNYFIKKNKRELYKQFVENAIKINLDKEEKAIGISS